MTYKISIKIIVEEQTMNELTNNYILERLKEIEIDKRSTKIYSQVVQQKVKDFFEYNNPSINSYKIICITSNTSNTSYY